jgi:HSP20 family molecular chaperone IbpA
LEVNNEMPESEDFDDMFDELWRGDFIKKFFHEQGRLHRQFMEQIKQMQEDIISGKLKGKTEFKPIEKPGVKGFIFRGIFGTPEITEQERIPETTEDGIENKESFALPETKDVEEREPIVETLTDGSDFVALVELPGIDEQDIKMETGDTWVRIQALNFKMTTINIPSNADISKVSKKYRNGVLEIRIPLGISLVEDRDVKFGIV